MVRLPEETTFRDDGPVLLQQSIREFRHVHRAMGEQYDPASRDITLQLRQLGNRFRDNPSVRIEDSLRPPEEKVPLAQCPRCNRLRKNRSAAGRVVLQTGESVEEIGGSNDPSDAQGAEAGHFRHCRESDHSGAELRGTRRRVLERKLAERLVDEHAAVALLRYIGELPKVGAGERGRCRIVQVRENEKGGPSSRRVPPAVQVESPSVLTVSRDLDDLRADAPGYVAEGRIDRDVHEDPFPWMDETRVDQEVRFGRPGCHEDPFRTRAVPVRNQPPQLRRPTAEGPVQVEVLRQLSPEAIEVELADVREGDVQPGAVDLLIIQQVLERREVHPAERMVRQPMNLRPFPFAYKNKSRAAHSGPQV